MANAARRWGAKHVVGVLVGLVALLALVQFAVYWLAPAQRYAQGVIEQVYAATGARLSMGDRPHLWIFPRVMLTLTNVSAAAGSDTAPSHLGTVEEIHLRISPGALLRGEIAIDHVVLYNPVVALVADAEGGGNWQLRGQGVPAAWNLADGEASPERSTDETRRDRYRIADVRVINGKVTYANVARGIMLTVGAVNLNVFVPSVNGPLSADGYVAWHGDNVQTQVAVANLGNLIDGVPTRVSLDLNSKVGHLACQGLVGGDDAFAGEGTLEVAGGSLPALVAFLRGAEPSPRDAPMFAGRAEFALDASGCRIAGVRLEVGDAHLTGDVALYFDAERPRVAARLAADVLDPTSLLEAAMAQEEPELDPWTDRLIPLDGLTAVDADLDLYAESLRLREITLGPNHWSATTTYGGAAMALNEMILGDGSARARVAVDVVNGMPHYTGSLIATEVDAQALVAGLLDASLISGAATGHILLESTGRTMRELVECLRGRGEMRLHDGALHGVDMAALTGNVVRLVARKISGNERRTDFDRVSATFAIRDGVVYNEDLLLHRTGFGFAASGTTSLVDHSLDVRLVLRRPLINVPVAVSGTWAEMDIRASMPRPALRGIGRPTSAPGPPE